jgi:hypothetical protein
MTATSAVILAAALLLSGCADLADRRSETFEAADSAAVHLTNSRLIEHYEDMNQRNLLLAAASERLDVMSAERLAPPSNSIYEWNALVLGFTAQDSGFASGEVIECWKYVFEGRFLRSGPDEVTCPASPPIEISVPPTVPPSTWPPQLVQEFAALRDQLSATLGDIDTRVMDSAQLQSLVTEALAKFEPDSVDAVVLDQVAAVAVRYRDVCLFGRTGDPVEVWQPVFGNAVDTCTPSKASEGGP